MAEPGDNRKAPKSKTPAKPSERRRGSKTNKPGSARSGGGRVTFSAKTTTALRTKVKEHNDKHGGADSKRVTLGKLKAVYRRGAGAYSTSHSPNVSSRDQWAMARVNAFLKLVRDGKPRNAKYVGDNDLLPAGHPRKGKKGKKES